MKAIILTTVTLLASLGMMANNPNESRDDKPSKNKYYVWEIKTQRGYAKGTTNSEAAAKRAVKLMNKGEKLYSKSIKSYVVN